MCSVLITKGQQRSSSMIRKHSSLPTHSESAEEEEEKREQGEMAEKAEADRRAFYEIYTRCQRPLSSRRRERSMSERMLQSSSPMDGQTSSSATASPSRPSSAISLNERILSPAKRLLSSKSAFLDTSKLRAMETRTGSLGDVLQHFRTSKSAQLRRRSTRRRISNAQRLADLENFINKRRDNPLLITIRIVSIVGFSILFLLLLWGKHRR